MQKLENQDILYEAFFIQSPSLLTIARKSGTFLKVNPAWEQLLGWSEAEMTAQPWIHFVHPDDVDATNEKAEQMGDETIPSGAFKNRYRAKDGSYKTILWVTSIFIEGLAYAIAIHLPDPEVAK